MITTVNLEFSVSGQTLTAQQEMPYLLASNTVNYVKVHFALGEDWQSVDTVSAVWSGVVGCYATVLDNDGDCFVPQEILARKQRVYVNLVGSDVDNDEVVDRITTYPVNVINVNATAYTCGSETVPLTPSQFEQYVAIVSDLVHSVKDIDRIELNEDYTLTVYYSDGTSWTSTSIRGEQGETGNGIASAVLNDDYTLTLTFTDGTSYTTSSIRGEQGPQGEPGEVTMEQLASVLPTDTASGAIASFPDGSDLFDYLSCVIDIDPVQDLHGYDKPWVGGAGKNKLDQSAYTSLDATSYSNGVFTAESLSEFKSAMVRLYKNGAVVGTFNEAPTEGSRVAISITVDSTWDACFIGYRMAGVYNIGGMFNKPNVPDGTYTVSFMADKLPSESVYGKFSNIQFESGSTATTFEPWQNLCLITGWTGCEVKVSGVNVWDEVWEVGSLDANGANETANDRIRSKNYIAVVPNTTYYIKAPYGVWFWGYDANKTFVQRVPSSNSINNTTFTVPNGIKYLRFVVRSNYGSTYNNDISINYPSTDTTYHAYNGTTYNITWQTEAGTVYGGTVDLVTGVLTVDRASVDLSTLTWSARPGWGGFRSVSIASDVKKPPTTSTLLTNCKCSTYNQTTAAAIGMSTLYSYAIDTDGAVLLRMEDGKTASDITGQLVYELATPQTYQLTPTQIHALLGQNNVWADCGNTSVTYKADVQRWVEKKLGQ